MRIREALQAAEDAELDLVEISPTAVPPVCRIMDYGKFLYEQDKKRAAANKKQKRVQVKEIKIRSGTEEGDYQVKLRNLIRFLEEGNKVKVTLRFRGREISHQSLGLKVLQRMQADLAEVAVIEQAPQMEGRQLGMLVAPKKKG
ncbi:MAG: translation initiation factor [Gammaproteobacteria bacterium]|nr:translation initiation factor [Gammaproteobacteria bacterium]